MTINLYNAPSSNLDIPFPDVDPVCFPPLQNPRSWLAESNVPTGQRRDAPIKVNANRFRPYPLGNGRVKRNGFNVLA